jgi:hypothetical protein
MRFATHRFKKMGEATEKADFRNNLKQTKKVDAFLEEMQAEAAKKAAEAEEKGEAKPAEAAPPPAAEVPAEE